MNANWRLIAWILMLLLLWGCNRRAADQSPGSENTGTDLYVEQELGTIGTYLRQAEAEPQGAGGYADIEFYYQRALEELDYLSLTHGRHPAYLEMYERVSESYDHYLAEVNSEPGDTLTADLVLQELSDIYAEDSAAVSADTLKTERIPIVLNRQVERAISYFTKGKGRRVFQRWLERSGRYETMVKSLLRAEGAPEELFYLAMIESGLNPRARSYARAVGMWQFIAATGRAYDLHQSWWFDDRRDPVKASVAAGRHLIDLYERFGDWYLAIAGYNFSPAKIERRMKRYNVNEFWQLPRLPRQTRNYVPTYLAAVTIAGDPAKYGFEITFEEPLGFDTMTVRECVDLNVVAESIGSTYTELKALNPALLRWCTPPDVDRWVLNLPPGSRETFAAKYDEIPKEKKMSWVHHRIRSGETLSTIARRYGVAVSEIRRFNKIRGSLIRAGHNLVIPIPANKKHYQTHARKSGGKRSSYSASRSRPQPVTHVEGRKKLVYTVRQGDSLWKVAQAYQVTVNQLRSWNGLGYSRLIKPGQTLNIWLADTPAKSTELAVAAAPATTTPAESDVLNGKATVHQVRSGDTLWDIARSYQVSIGDIKRWNGKRNNTIKPGEKLTIYFE